MARQPRRPTRDAEGNPDHQSEEADRRALRIEDRPDIAPRHTEGAQHGELMASTAGTAQENRAQGGDRNQPEERGQDLGQGVHIPQIFQLVGDIRRLNVSGKWSQFGLQMFNAGIRGGARCEPHRHHPPVGD